MSASENLRVATTSPATTLTPKIEQSPGEVEPIAGLNAVSQIEKPQDDNPTKTLTAASAPAAAHPPVGAPVSASVLKELRRRRARKLLMRILFLVVLPTLISSVYFGLVATSEYESTSIFVIERRAPDPSVDFSAAVTPNREVEDHTSVNSKVGSKSQSGSLVREEALLAKDYILSRDMLAALDRETHLLAHYENPTVDFLSRLSANSGKESAHDYFLKKLSVNHDPNAATITVKLRAFDSKTAMLASEVILQATERMLCDLSAPARKDRLALAELEVQRARAQSAQLDATLANRKGPDASKPPQPRGTSQQPALAPQRNSDAGQPTLAAAPPLPASDAQLALRAELVQRRLARAEEQLLRLTDEAKGKDRYVVRVAGPSEPDEATYPRRGRAVLTTLLFSIVGMGILSLLFSAIREHTDL
jgi:capsular polysaccharide transport system permease protein